VVDEGKGVGPLKNGVYLDFADAIERLGRDAIADKYGNLFDMYERITGENPYDMPMRIYPAPHYTMGGLWVDYHLQTTVPGLFAIGEANFSDHGANRLGASALMQGLADGYFVLPYTIGDYLAPSSGRSRSTPRRRSSTRPRPRCRPAPNASSTTAGRAVDWFHRELGKILWDYCGMERNRRAREGPVGDPGPAHRVRQDVRVLGSAESLNSSLEKAGRVADFFELAELMCKDALTREESCGGTSARSTRPRTARRCATTRTSRTSPPGSGPATPAPQRTPRAAEFDYVKLSQRSYK
jgi:succinate dehydrogenase / fumarate reductase, flavoprotein subunit